MNDLKKNKYIFIKKIKFFKKIYKKILKIKSKKIIIINNDIILKNSKINNFIKIKKNKNINIKINKNIKKKTPLQIIFINFNKNKIIYKTNIVIKKNTYIHIIKEFINLKKKKKNYINYKNKILIKENSYLNYYNLINLNKKSYFKYKNKIILYKKSKLNKFIFSIKSKKINFSNNIILKKKSNIKIYSFFYVKKKNFFKYKTITLHNLNKSKSYQKNKNIILKLGKFKFSNLIKINKKSNYTKAIIKNNNLCINKNSIIESFPKLNIWNKNTNCKHYVIINNLNKKEIFYLLTRGIKYKKIKKILLISFIKEILNYIKIKDIYINIYNLIKKKI